ncbi:MAG: hypothetical protein IT336_07380 [Thermomicrobiales bacterium]|nr:hypothetical protein [Thermomicrobiales bacterium]
MSLNPVTCGNCGTENSPEEDFCVNCGPPLTGSADESIRESLEAQESDGLFDHGGATPGVGMVGGAGGIVTPLLPDDDPRGRASRG